MPKPKKGRRLGGSPAHQRLMLANLATSLFEHGAIRTTETRARLLRPYAEKLITKAKKAHLGENPLHQRREVLKVIRDKSVVHELFTEIAPTFAERPGGYTRITKLGPRPGDNAPMAMIELVTEEYAPKASAPAKAAAPAVEEAPVEDEVVEETEATDAEETEAEVVESEETDETVEVAEDVDTEADGEQRLEAESPSVNEDDDTATEAEPEPEAEADEKA